MQPLDITPQPHGADTFESKESHILEVAIARMIVENNAVANEPSSMIFFEDI